MRIFSSSFIEDARFLYNNILDRGIKTWQELHNAFTKRWENMEDGRLLWTQFNQIKKKEV
jgi:hypothetical protein